jgi:uncharacterized membrane protein YeaQ/YmgE (transglycosylase-associated protein family)
MTVDSNLIMNLNNRLIRRRVQSTVLAATISVSSFVCFAQTKTNAASIPDQVGNTATEVTQTTLNEVESLWKRIDDRRLKNRTPDELVAWLLMGLLVGGLVSRFGKFSQVTTILIGLLGAFIGGIIANVIKLDLGLGPVLIRYEDLLCSILGGLALLFAWKWYKGRMAAKPAHK